MEIKKVDINSVLDNWFSISDVKEDKGKVELIEFRKLVEGLSNRRLCDARDHLNNMIHMNVVRSMLPIYIDRVNVIKEVLRIKRL